eukprot:gene25925-26094_t
MILKRLFQRSPAPERSSYEAIVAAARHPAFYAQWNVPDTLDGRFDMITLHMFLVLDRLKGKAEAFRQALGRAEGFEEVMDAARRVHREQAFRVGVQVMSGTASAAQAGAAFADLADLCIGAW